MSAPASCCDTHDGPHMHGCVVRRSASGEEHRGGCLREQGTSIEAPSSRSREEDQGAAEGISGRVSTPLEDPNGWELPEEYAIRQQLGLRPASYPASDAPATHPDQRPCPPWCTGTGGDSDHEIDPARPFVASHNTDMIATAASAYRGTVDSGAGRLVAPTTIETMLEQLGQGGQRIHVYLRHYPLPRSEMSWTKLLALSITDAAELATVLTHLIAQADAGDALRSAEQ